ncbi:hypothetical protein CEXT_544181 [Caerostris extrusa]|uniref:Uncharacterized protein n=1 Tax=Caerostris extrusa TaxID=172846 RepID=A0AAV4TWE5_CAEEX|nr:hypothetical protein CEXT_544181 [Caerostris extrusa]
MATSSRKKKNAAENSNKCLEEEIGNRIDNCHSQTVATSIEFGGRTGINRTASINGIPLRFGENGFD